MEKNLNFFQISDRGTGAIEARVLYQSQQFTLVTAGKGQVLINNIKNSLIHH